MDNNCVKVGVVTPKIKLADPIYNAEQIIAEIAKARTQGVKLLVMPELTLTGATCGDLFLSPMLWKDIEKLTAKIAASTTDITAVIGVPLSIDGMKFSAAMIVRHAEIFGFVINCNLSSQQRKIFSQCNVGDELSYCGKKVKLLYSSFDARNYQPIALDFSFTVNFYGLFVPKAINICMCSKPILADNYYINRQKNINNSAQMGCSYVMCNNGCDESGTDNIYGGSNIIICSGNVLGESELFSNEMLVSEVDYSAYRPSVEDVAERVPFSSRLPFVPIYDDEKDLILTLTAKALERRLTHIGTSRTVIGVSGGLDSTLALITAANCADTMGISRKNIIAITMPCFGTSKRTYENAKRLMQLMGVTAREVNISKSTMQHFEEIGHSGSADIAYQNAQARNRMMVSMDIANMENAVVVGTGDMSELALGFTTYGGDHMSMYSVNCGISKTLVKSLTAHYAKKCGGELGMVLNDILNTDISPELLPTDNGEIVQKTESILGSYEINDFFLYHTLRCRLVASEILALARGQFVETTPERLTELYNKFIKRFFTQQFKRSCAPDGVAVYSLSLSPRCGFMMPSDAAYNAFEIKD